MNSITIDDLDDDIMTYLRERATEHQCSVEDEVRAIISSVVHIRLSGPRNLAEFTRECFEPIGGVELKIPPRGSMNDPPDFS